MPLGGRLTDGHRGAGSLRVLRGRGGGSVAPGCGGGPPPRAHARLAGTNGGGGGRWLGCVVGAASWPSTSRLWRTLRRGWGAPRRPRRRASRGRDRPRRRGGGRDGAPPRRPHPRGPSADASVSSGRRRSRGPGGGKPARPPRRVAGGNTFPCVGGRRLPRLASAAAAPVILVRRPRAWNKSWGGGAGVGALPQVQRWLSFAYLRLPAGRGIGRDAGGPCRDVGARDAGFDGSEGVGRAVRTEFKERESVLGCWAEGVY